MKRAKYDTPDSESIGEELKGLLIQVIDEVEKAPEDTQVKIASYLSFELARHFYEKERLGELIKKLKNQGISPD